MERVESLFRPEVRETQERPIAGIGVVLIHAKTGEIWVLQELVGKDVNGRIPGQLSIPLETRKRNESIRENLIGALAEVYDDVDIAGNDIRGHLVNGLFHLEEGLFHAGFEVKQKARNIFCDIATIFYDGPTLEIAPFNSLEVSQGGWVNPMRFLDGGEDVRPLARQVVDNVLRNGIYEDALRAYHDTASTVHPLLTMDFSIREMYRRRETVSDMQ